MEIKNRKAYFNYFIKDKLESGIVLTGTEIKSIRKGSANIKDSYIRVKNSEAYIINMYIAKYEEGAVFNHDEYRERKLLLHKKEIKYLQEECKIEGLTLIPLEIYLKGNKAKVLIGICKGKKLYDKRETIKQKDIEREKRKY